MMQARTRRCCLVCLWLLLAAGPATGAGTATDPERRARIDGAVEGLRREHDVPGVGLAVIADGRIVHARGYGRLGRGETAPVTAETRFQACSLSKPLVAMALLALVDAGRLRLDAPVNDYLSAWRIPENGLTGEREITVRELLTHSSGLTAGMHPGYPRGAALPARIVDVLEARPPTTSRAVRPTIPVGTWRYSNGAFAVAQLLLEELTGEPLAPYMQHAVLAPLGMERSTYASPFPAALAAPAARGHGDDGEPLPGGWREHRAQAVAGLWSTPSDLARSLIAVQRMVAGETGLLLRPETAREMLAPQPVEPQPHFTEVPVFAPRQGIGYLLEGQDPASGGSLRFWAWGDNTGYKALEVALIDASAGAVVMTNAQSGAAITRPIVEFVAREYGWALPGDRSSP